MSARCFAARTTRCSRTGCICRSAITAAPARWSSAARRPPAARPAEAAGGGVPIFGPCKRLDFELEMGVVVGQPSAMGEMLTEAQAEAMIFGFMLLNDWSARDIQQWEYVPLGPFQAKAFATSIGRGSSPARRWSRSACNGPAQDPAPLPYLAQRAPTITTCSSKSACARPA